MRTIVFHLCVFCLVPVAGRSQGDIDLDTEAFQVQEIFSEVLAHGECYAWLDGLTQIGPRLSGSEGYETAVTYMQKVMDTLGLDSVWLQPCMVPRWVRGESEQAVILNSPNNDQPLACIALGGSIGTGPAGVAGNVIEVKSVKELQELPSTSVDGNIVFFNGPLDVTLVNTFLAYKRAVDQRYTGPYEAARRGALAAVVRSMTTSLDDIPHTGTSRYEPAGPNIPAVAISTNDADLLSDLLTKQAVRLRVTTHCEWLDSVRSYNVIGQINGSTHPDEIILVGGHLDSWDVGQGAHDDGAGCVQSLEVLRTVRAMGYQPRRTLRCVLFANEENGLAGAKTYAQLSNAGSEFHLAAIESDAGGFTPRGFSFVALQDQQPGYVRQVATWWGLLEAYGLDIETSGSGSDIEPLRSQGGLLCGYRCDTQRYFDLHHSAADIFATVNERELKMGAASITSLVYLLDKYLTRVQ